jgi:iron complex outermembrane recepter protein
VSATKGAAPYAHRRRCRGPHLVAVLVAAFAATAAKAERAQENVVTVAEDAFGLAIGNQSVGLYSMADARGFSPQQAGNLRIEGLYFDSPSNYVGPCTAHATVMRIGITAQPYSFPSPTGIADLKLQMPGEEIGGGAVLSRGPYTESSALLEGQMPLGPQLGGAVCGAYNRDFSPADARQSENLGVGATLRWRPSARTEVVPFWSAMAGGQHADVPTVYTDGTSMPPLFDVRQLATQPFTSAGWRTGVLGVVVRQSFGADWLLNAGLFRSREQDRRSYIDEYLSVQPNGEVMHELDVLPPLTSTSTSGELRLVRRFGGGDHERKLDFSLRGRSADRAYGGDSLYCYGSTTLTSGPPAAAPPLCPESPPPDAGASADQTRQIDAGIVYEERWKGIGTIGLGILKSHYRRTIRVPGFAPESSLSTPWLMNLRFTINAGRALTIYGSYLQGLEDSALAPSIALNQGEPPPATRTHQVDSGLRYAPTDKLSLVVGAFEIHKVYFNLAASPAGADPVTYTYSALGTVRHRGLESSFAYAADGLTLLLGGVWLKPHLERTVPEPGATGSVPIGPVPLTLSAILDWAPARLQPFAASLQLNHLSARVATTDNQFSLPPMTTVGAGLRYESKLRGHPFSVRFDAANLTDARGLHLSPVGQLVPELGRRFVLSISIDH